MSSIRVVGRTTSPIPAMSAQRHPVIANFREILRSYPRPNVSPTPVPLVVTGDPPPGGVTVKVPCAAPTPALANRPDDRQGYHNTTTVRLQVWAMLDVSARKNPSMSSTNPKFSTPNNTLSDSS